MAKQDNGSGNKERSRLSRDAWLDAAGEAIAAGGFDNVRILVLAKQLGVSRGSFYWHFRDHRDLIEGYLSRWRDRRFKELEYLDPGEDARDEDLRHALQLVLSEPGRDTRRLRIGLAVRDYARRDEFAARIVAEVDRSRIAYNERLLQRFTADPREAHDLSMLLYLTVVGGQLIMTAGEGEPSVARMEQLIGRLIRRWLGTGSSSKS